MPATSASSSTNTPTLRALQIRLKSRQNMFNDIYRFIQTISEDTNAIQIKVRLDKIDELWEKVNDAFLDVETHEDFPIDDKGYSKQRSDFGERYYEAKSIMLEKVRELEDVPNLNEPTTQQSTIEHVRLPQIQLHSFDGNLDTWLSFRDLYTSLIHSKNDLPDVEKFYYLKGCLLGEAKALIEPLPITKANYQVAWELLMKRYNNSKLLKRQQIQSLFQLPRIIEESSIELQSLLEAFERIVQTLDQLVQPSDYKDLLLLNILGSRLDPVTRRGWEEFTASKEQDTILSLIEFLQRRVRMLNLLPTQAKETKVDCADRFIPYHNLQKTSYVATQPIREPCVACSEMHFLYLCPNFRRMAVFSRDQLVRDHKLCINCFKRGHQAAKCLSRYVCRNCGTKHHTMVCFRSNKGQGKAPRKKSYQEEPKEFVPRSQIYSPSALNTVTSGTRSSQISSHVAMFAKPEKRCCKEQHGRHTMDRGKLHKGPIKRRNRKGGDSEWEQCRYRGPNSWCADDFRYSRRSYDDGYGYGGRHNSKRCGYGKTYTLRRASYKSGATTDFNGA